MKKVIKAVTLLGCVMASTVAVAQTCNSTANTCSGVISRVNVGGTGTVAIAIEGVNIPSGAGCSSPSNFSQIPADSPTVTANYAAALTAFASGSNIVIRTFANDPSCTVRSLFVGE